jgi:hypothetical protein
MRTKTILLSAAALVAGLASSMAQSNVYSVNVVGYVNKSLPGAALALVATPLDTTTNKLSTIFAGLPNASQVFVWNGAGYSSASKAKGVWSTDLDIPPGVGLFVRSATPVTNTYVGEVTANVGQSVTNPLPASVTTLVGSLVPYSGDLGNTNLGLGPQLDNGSQVFKWNGSGYNSSSKAKGVWSVNLSFEVGEGIFVRSATAKDWVQTLPAN